MLSAKPRFGEQLLAADVLTREALEKGLELQKSCGGYLVDVLLAHKLVEERKLLRFLAETSGARYITSDKLAKASIPPETLDRIPVRHAERMQVLPLNFANGTLTLAIAEIELGLVEEVRLAAGIAAVVPIIATRAAIRAGIKRFYYGDTYAFVQMEEPSASAVVEPRPAGTVIAREASRVEPAAVPAEGGKAQEPDDPVKLRRELRLLRLASELHRHLSREREPGEILHRVLAFAFDNLPADDGVLLSVDPRTGEFTPHAVRTRSGDCSQVVISDTLLREVIETRQGVLTGDALADERFNRSESIVGAGLRSAIGVPLVVAGEVRGVIFLDTREIVNVFSEQDLSMLMAIAGQAAISLENAELSRQIAAETATRAHLARFLSPGLVEQAASGAFSLSGVGEVQQATILFADIRGFTSLSERFGPREVVAMLNEHFAQMVDLVFAHGGVLDKFIGDALMAVWGIPIGRDDAPARALRAALEMVERVKVMNAVRTAEGKVPLEIGIGINSGPVVFGAIGAPRRMDFTAIGDAVNTAARLCDLAGPGQFVASETTLHATGGSFVAEALPPARLKGKSQPIRAYAVQKERTLGVDT